jgi:hypothetical protein
VNLHHWYEWVLGIVVITAVVYGFLWPTPRQKTDEDIPTLHKSEGITMSHESFMRLMAWVGLLLIVVLVIGAVVLFVNGNLVPGVFALALAGWLVRRSMHTNPTTSRR